MFDDLYGLRHRPGCDIRDLLHHNDINPASATSTCSGTPVCATGANKALAGATGIAAVNIGGCPGYYVTDAAGQVAAFGAAVFHGDKIRAASECLDHRHRSDT